MIDFALWVASMFALPAVVVIASWSALDRLRLRWLAVACAVGVVVVSAVPLVVPTLRDVSLGLALASAVGTAEVLRIDSLSGALLPFGAALWAVSVTVTPRAALSRRGMRLSALATMTTLVGFLTRNPLLMLLVWTTSAGVFLAWLGAPEYRRARRVASFYLGISTMVFVAGLLCITWPEARVLGLEKVGIWLIVAAVLGRKGIFPFHAWIPELFERGRLGATILFTAPQMGAYVTAVLVVPRASNDVLRVVSVLALCTAVYGAALALVQTDARRCCGYLFVSQSALVLAGLDCTSRVALAGGLSLWLSSGLAFAGLAWCVLVLEARRGRLDLSKHHGGHERMPLLAGTFLVTGLACVGFPGTLGFVGQELLVQGALQAFPLLGFAVVLAGALTGLAVLRMYFSLFCGRRDAGVHLKLLPRETLAFGTVMLALVLAGLMPGSIVRSRVQSAEELLQLRAPP